MNNKCTINIRDSRMYIHWIHPRNRAIDDKQLWKISNSYRVLISTHVFRISSTKGSLSGVKSLALQVRGWVFSLGYLIIILENNLIVKINTGKLVGNYGNINIAPFVLVIFSIRNKKPPR